MTTKKYGSLRLVAGDLVLTNAAETAFLTISFPTSGTKALNLASGIENDSTAPGASVADALDGLQGVIGASITSLTGDVTTVGSGAAAATIAAQSITNAKVSNTAAIAYSKLNLAGSVTDGDLAGNIAVNKLSPLTTGRALVTSGPGYLSVSSTTATEIGFLSGVTSDIQTQLGTKIPNTEKGSALGVATLDAGGKVPASQLPSSIMEYKGTYNAATNTPSLSNGTGDAGDIYVVSVAGTRNFGAGPITFAAGDWVLYNGTQYEKSVNSNAVASVNGKTGVVVLDKTDIGLDQVDNTSDADKPISNDTQTALNSKEDTITILDLARGGTGVSASTADDLLNALLPDQTSSAGQFLTTNGAVTSWGVVSQPVATYTTTWTNAQGAVKVVTHGLNTTLLQVSIWDDNSNLIHIDNIHVDSLTQATLTSSIAPPIQWTVVIVGVL